MTGLFQGSKKDKDKPAHPLDVNYNLLKCDLERVDPKSKEYKVSKNIEDILFITGEKCVCLAWHVEPIPFKIFLKKCSQSMNSWEPYHILNTKYLK